MADSTDDELAELAADLHAALEATAELPVEASASRWLGEAEAVAGDAARAAREADAASGADPDGPEAVVEARVEQVRMLLSNVDATGSEAADQRVGTARELAAEIDSRL
ncbi:hypothetical protein [Halorussus marinus]|uniref:hypothetical protein n=1 Tax=Halorussus marinus TaxID=2505976 RepID=UPI00106E66D8|nr:hypothetical protein [Halorussus marinus]